MATSPHAPRTTEHLERVLGPWMATALIVGTVIGSGVFKKPTQVAHSVPNFGWAISAWVLLGLLVICGGLALTEVIILYPRAGGNYVFLREGYGRLWGFLWGWVEFFVIRSASLAALATIFSEALHDVLRHESVRASLGLAETGPVLDFWPLQGLTIVTILVLALVNARGVRWGGGLQLFVTIIKVGSLLFIALLPFALALRTSAASGGAAHWDYLTAPAPRPISWLNFGAALIAVQWAYHGWMNLGPVGEEIRNPQRNVPLAMVSGIGIVMFLYCSANVAYSLVLSQSEMAKLDGTTSVGAEFARRLLGPTGGALIAGAIAVSTFGALNGNLLVGPRLLYAMGADGLAPRVLSEVHPRYKTPAVATIVLALWAVALIVIGALLTQHRLPAVPLFGRTFDLNLPKGKPLFDVLTDFAMFGAVVFETMAVASIFMFRWKRPDAERPYRCLGYPWTPLIYVVCYVGLLASYFTEEKRVEAYSGLGFALVGAVIYLLFLRRR
jgi:APA family basic amino acid/polyamine antiporter